MELSTSVRRWNPSVLGAGGDDDAGGGAAKARARGALRAERAVPALCLPACWPLEADWPPSNTPRARQMAMGPAVAHEDAAALVYLYAPQDASGREAGAKWGPERVYAVTHWVTADLSTPRCGRPP